MIWKTMYYHFYYLHFVTFWFIFVVLGCTSSLRLIDLQVPELALEGGYADLSCHWDLGSGEQLYSVKWYKDGDEFFRYIPKKTEPERFELPGVTVEAFEKSESNIRVILSHVVGMNTSGRYRCEVSGERPTFLTVSEYRDMNVAVPPQNGPRILGFRSKYRISEKVEAKCKCGPSRPAARLTWYVNGKHVDMENFYFEERDMNTSTILLNFPVETKHFKQNILSIKCVATISSVYSESNEKAAVEDKSAFGEMTRRATSKADNNRSDSSNIINDSRIVVIWLVIHTVVLLAS